MYVGDTQAAAATFVHAYGFEILIPAGIDLKGSARAADHGVTTQGIPAAMSRRSPRQLYVDLRGFHLTGAAMSGAEALRALLDAFGVPVGRIPAGLQAQATPRPAAAQGRRPYRKPCRRA
jgi:hypothetical protein